MIPAYLRNRAFLLMFSPCYQVSAENRLGEVERGQEASREGDITDRELDEVRRKSDFLRQKAKK